MLQSVSVIKYQQTNNSQQDFIIHIINYLIYAENWKQYLLTF